MSDAPLRADKISIGETRLGLAAKLGWAALAMVPGGCLLGVSLEQLFKMLNTNGSVFVALAAMSPVLLSIAALWFYNRQAAIGDGARIENGKLVLSRFGNEEQISREQLRSGVVLEATHSLLLERVNGDELLIPVPRTQSAEEWLNVLGLGTQQRRLQVTMRRWLYLLLYGLLLAPYIAFGVGIATSTAGLRLFGATGASIGITLGIILGPLVAFFLGKEGLGTRFTVGADGVRVRRFGLTTFFPYSQLDKVSLVGGGTTAREMQFERKDGTTYTVWADGDVGMSPEAVLDRIQEAMRVAQSGSVAAAPAEALARQGRSLSDWQAALKKLVSGVGDYRAMTVDRGTLVAIVRDPDAPIEQRVAAAIALASTGDEKAKEQVRVAAEASASDRVRAVLSQAVEGTVEEASLESALKEERVRVQE